MNRDEKYIIRILFKNKIYSSDAQAFEDLFTKIMSYKYNDFYPVKPQGAFGDMKNDGYIVSSGVFYQVYGPEDIEKSIDNAIKKVKEDFEGLIKNWSNKTDINEFVYVVNDKYKGAQVKVHEKLMKLRTELQDLQSDNQVIVSLMVAKSLENIMFELEEDAIIDIIGGLPPSKIEILDIDYQAVNEVIEHVMNIPASIYKDDLYVPDFEDKIKINGLSSIIKNRLQTAAFNFGDIDNFFNYQGEFLREDIRNRFKELYEISKIEISCEDEDCADRRYMYIQEKSMPNNRTIATQFAVECLMAYYFESCDIFESPKKGENE